MTRSRRQTKASACLRGTRDNWCLTIRDRLTTLTTREREVMSLAAEGHSNDEIAEKLYVGPLTVRAHIQRATTELGARDRAQWW